MKCYICQSTTEELRPYGKNGQPICFDCMMGSNETQAEAKRQFGAALDGAAQHSEMVLIGKETGPEPVGGNRH